MKRAGERPVQVWECFPMISLVFAAALLAAGEPAAAPASAAGQAATPAKKTAAKDPNEMVCKREMVLGSRMKERICMTQAQWDTRRSDDRDNVEKAQSIRPFEAH
jgi:hypothetical protein